MSVDPAILILYVQYLEVNWVAEDIDGNPIIIRWGPNEVKPIATTLDDHSKIKL